MSSWIQDLLDSMEDYDWPSFDEYFDDEWLSEMLGDDDFNDGAEPNELNLPDYPGDDDFENDYPDTVDDHDVWEDNVSEVTQEIVSSLIDETLRTTAESMKGCGHIPGELKEIIEGLNKPLAPVFDWKQAFRRFLGNAYSEYKKHSLRKESRRFKGAAGTKHMKRSNILVAIDTSGSVSNEELHEFVSELTYMYKTGTQIHVLECDARIQREYDYKPGCITGVAGRGGTRFEPVIDYYREHYKLYETLVYLTDGGANINLDVPGNNMLWVISSKGMHQDYPGKALYIPSINKQ